MLLYVFTGLTSHAATAPIEVRLFCAQEGFMHDAILSWNRFGQYLILLKNYWELLKAGSNQKFCGKNPINTIKKNFMRGWASVLYAPSKRRSDNHSQQMSKSFYMHNFIYYSYKICRTFLIPKQCGSCSRLIMFFCWKRCQMFYDGYYYKTKVTLVQLSSINSIL